MSAVVAGGKLMKKLFLAALAVLIASTGFAEARYLGNRGHWHGHRDRVIIEQPAAGIGLGIGALLLLSQMGQQKQYVAEEPTYERPAPRRQLREPKLRDNPVPLK